MIRAFLAIELPNALRPGLAQIQAELKQSRADVRWVAVSNIHLTLKFFGNVPEDEIEALALAAREAAAETAPCSFRPPAPGPLRPPTPPGWCGWGWGVTCCP